MWLMMYIAKAHNLKNTSTIYVDTFLQTLFHTSKL